MTIQRITQASQCTPGRLYCAFRDDLDQELVWYGDDGSFYDADTNEEVHPEYDYLVEQVGAFASEYA